MTQTQPRTVDDLVADALPMLPLIAAKIRLPPGLNADDLESAGNEAVYEAAVRFDPTAGVPWKAYAYHRAKDAMRAAVRAKRARPTVSLQPLSADGDELPPPADPKAADPAALAAGRELVCPPARPPRLTADRAAAALPGPAAVADRVERLRAAMFGAVSEADVAAVMATVVARARGGNLQAARLVVDLLAPGKSGVTVTQQNVVVRPADLD